MKLGSCLSFCFFVCYLRLCQVVFYIYSDGFRDKKRESQQCTGLHLEDKKEDFSATLFLVSKRVRLQKLFLLSHVSE